jgi:hypothetical protein
MSRCQCFPISEVISPKYSLNVVKIILFERKHGEKQFIWVRGAYKLPLPICFNRVASSGIIVPF